MTESFKETAHFHGNGIFGYKYTSTTRPRFSIIQTSYRKTKSTEQVLRVDGIPVKSKEAAEAALMIAPKITQKEADALAMLTTEWAEREQQRQIGFGPLRALADRGLVEWNEGKVRRVEGCDYTIVSPAKTRPTP